MLAANNLSASKNEKKHSLTPAVQQAIASLRLEGITLSNESVEDVVLYSRGKLSKEDAIKRVLVRVKSD